MNEIEKRYSEDRKRTKIKRYPRSQEEEEGAPSGELCTVPKAVKRLEQDEN